VDRADLNAHIRALATLPETDVLMVSCYLGITRGRLSRPEAFEERVRDLRSALSGREREDFKNAIGPIRSFISSRLLPDTRGAAIFSRAGAEQFCLPLQFHVPLPDWVAVDTVPNIYRLVELKDTYDRFVVVLCSKEDVHILGVNLGAVTKDLWQKRPALSKRQGREWTKLHHQRCQGHHRLRFFREQARQLEKFFLAGGFGHLILAGHPAATALMRETLPRSVAAKLVDRIPASSRTPTSDVVEASIRTFVAREEQESQRVTETLVEQVRSGGLATAGTDTCLEALRQGRAHCLVLAADYSPAPVTECRICRLLQEEVSWPSTCPECASEEWREFDPKEAMVRVAQQTGCGVEVVNQSEALTRLGGVGCLLRFRPPENMSSGAESRSSAA